MIIYVDASVIQTGNGTKENPFKTIQEAAAKALPGDEVIVAPGLYREPFCNKRTGAHYRK